MPHPGALNAYPSAPNNYPSGPDAAVQSVAAAWTNQTTWSTQAIVGSASSAHAAWTTATTWTATPSRTAPPFIAPAGPAVPQVRFPRLRLLFADTRTGRISYEAPFSDVSWSCTLNAEDSSTSATLVVEEVLEAIYAQVGEDPGQVLNEFLTGPYRYSMAICWGSAVLWAGPYLPSTDAPNAPTVSIAGSTLHHLLARRIVRNFSGTPTGGVGDPSRDLTMFTTPRGAAYQLVQNAIYNPFDGAARELPITCADVPDLRGDEAFTYLSYDVVTVEKALTDLAARIDGPDFRFDPYLYEGDDGAYLAWNLVLGDPLIPTAAAVAPSGPLPWVWDDRNSLIERDVDATGLATTAYMVGSGQDRDKIIVESDNGLLTSWGWPALEAANTSLSSETDAYKLGQYGAAIVGSTTAQTWKISAPYATADPQPGLFREGDLGRIDISQHLIIPRGSYYRRITKLGGNSTEFTAEFDPDTTASSSV